MTAPVVLQAAKDANGLVGAQRWRVHFVMPSEYSLASLSTPTNGAVTLREVPATLVAVGTAKLARYDPPWTLPMWRRNEIHMETLPGPAL